MDCKRHFLSLAHYSREELLSLLDRARQIKSGIPGPGSEMPLKGKSVGMIFEKPSTRTRVSFEVGIHQLGGQAIFLNRKDVQISRGEPIKDTARVLSRYLDGLVVRTFGHDMLEELAQWASIPVVNGLSDLLHPCQVLADLMTVQEAGIDIGDLHAAWVGDGNNMANSWINAARVLGFRLSLACPKGFEPSVPMDSANITLSDVPQEAVRLADVVSTDVWASMGQEDEAADRKAAFVDFQVNSQLLKDADKDAFVLHCLPAHRDEEITDEVMESDRSLIWEQAENRLHAQKAVLEMLCGA